jgi:hypothetical protein
LRIPLARRSKGIDELTVAMRQARFAFGPESEVQDSPADRSGTGRAVNKNEHLHASTLLHRSRFGDHDPSHELCRRIDPIRTRRRNCKKL